MTERHDFWSGRSVLITGCTGFLGSWLTRALVESGATVCALVRSESSFPPPVLADCADRVAVLRGELVDLGLFTRALEEHGVDTVFHTAAQTLVGNALKDPAGTFDPNVRGTWTLLEAVRRTPRPPRVVYSSSDKAYGDCDPLPYTEETPLLGRYPYEASKACGDMIACSYAATFDLPVAVTRCANFFGGGDMNWSRIVPGTIRSLIRNEPVVIRSDGTPLRDYLYIEDAVDACLALAERLDDPAVRGEAFNFGMDRPVSVLEMVRAVIAASGMVGVEPQVLGEASQEIQAQYLDSTRARRELEWKPAHTLGEGLEKTFAWYRDHLSD